ncbi:MAG: recombinase family protein [Schwartzia sp.]|nr:recombinase family protein [Schwartzia sp. (in: firmicutes)]
MTKPRSPNPAQIHKEQHEDRQRIALEGYGVPQENVFMDKMSGKNFERPGWKRLMKALRPDDLLVVKSVDRLGRNYEEMIEDKASGQFPEAFVYGAPGGARF